MKSIAGRMCVNTSARSPAKCASKSAAGFLDELRAPGFSRTMVRHAANHRSAETRRSELVEESSGRLGRAFRGRTRAGVDAHPARDALHGAGPAAIRARLALALSA